MSEPEQSEAFQRQLASKRRAISLQAKHQKRARSNLDPWRTDIMSWVEQDLDDTQIQEMLIRDHGARFSVQHISSAITTWLNEPVEAADDTAMRDRLYHLYNDLHLDDSAAMQELHKEGTEITLAELLALREELGLHRWLDNMEDTVVGDTRARSIHNNMLARHTRSEKESRGGTLDERMYYKRHRLQQAALPPRISEEIDGLNHTWSFNTLFEFKPFGIQISGAIDVYSRNIIFAWAGSTDRADHAMLVKYLEAVDAHGCIPHNIRIDGPLQHTQLEFVHNVLHDAIHTPPESIFQVNTGSYLKTVEGLWDRATKRVLGVWQNTFDDLKASSYDSTNLADRIAFLAV